MEAKESKYDIFISCKSEDYKLAKCIYDYLVENNLKVFLADAELRRIGAAEFGNVIDEALEAADHFILFASKLDYVTSPYVANEWRIFIEEKRSGRKKGNFLTILKGVDVDKLPISLRHHQNFPYSDFRNSLLYYIQPVTPIPKQHQWEPAVNELSKQVKFLKKVSILSTTLLVVCLVVFLSGTLTLSKDDDRKDQEPKPLRDSLSPPTFPNIETKQNMDIPPNIDQYR